MIKQQDVSWHDGRRAIDRYVEAADSRHGIRVVARSDGTAWLVDEGEAIDEQISADDARDIIQLLTEWLTEHHGKESR